MLLPAPQMVQKFDIQVHKCPIPSHNIPFRPQNVIWTHSITLKIQEKQQQLSLLSII